MAKLKDFTQYSREKKEKLDQVVVKKNEKTWKLKVLQLLLILKEQQRQQRNLKRKNNG